MSPEDRKRRNSGMARHRAHFTVLLATATVAALALGLLALTGTARGAPLEPPGKKVYFGVSDTGNPADFGAFTAATARHPAVIQSFRAWGADFPQSIKRWRTARARPMLHITTADPNDGRELITPAQIAAGAGDAYLLRLNKLFWNKKMAAYIRPLGEPNRCLNVYAAFDCAGRFRDREHSPRAYRRAFRRIYILVHGGGKTRKINARLAAAGLPPLTVRVRGLPAAPVAIVWSPLPAGSPKTPRNRPRHFYPGDKWVDWAGTDFYAAYPEWKALNGVYKRFKRKPFAITEWGVEHGDDPDFVRRLFQWVKSRPRVKMMVYYQDFGASSSYRIQNWPTSLEVMRNQLRSPLFPPFAKGFPRLPPPPPGGLGVGR